MILSMSSEAGNLTCIKIMKMKNEFFGNALGKSFRSLVTKEHCWVGGFLLWLYFLFSI